MIMQLLPKQIFPGFLILYYYHRGTQNHFDTSSFQLPAFVVQPKHSDTRQRTAQNESYAWIDFQSSAATLLRPAQTMQKNASQLAPPHENAAFTVNFLFPIFNHLHLHAFFILLKFYSKKCLNQNFLKMIHIMLDISKAYRAIPVILLDI